MANNRKVVQIFLASPGDLQDERQTAKAVVDAFNKRWADWFEIQIELVGWEDTFKRYGRPQAQINLDLDRCEAFVGLMWRKWGTPPGGQYTSGFEEEFERAFESRKKSARPEMTLFFKKIDDEFLKDQGPDLKRVLAFRQRVIEEQQILFHDFDSLKDFEERLTDWITHYFKHLKQREDVAAAIDEKAVSSDTATEKTEAVSPASSPLSPEGAQFLRDFVTKTERDRDTHPIEAIEVARFRLLTTLVGTPSNDEHSLGTHDANLLFQERDTLGLSQREMEGLLNCGLENVTNETVPLWHWYIATKAHEDGQLSLATLIGSQDTRIGALRAMRLIGEPIKTWPPVDADQETAFPRDLYIRSWLAPNSNERLKTAALEYLAACGETDDLAILKQEHEKRNYQTAAAAADAIIRIELRQSRERALRALIDLQPETVDGGLVAAVFAKPASLETKLLQDGVTHRNAKVRAAIVPILVNRGALPTDIAEKLLEDSEARVRYEALRSLEKEGKEFTDEKVKAILVKPTRAASPGFGALFSLAPLTSDKEGEAFWERYEKAKLRGLPTVTLEEDGPAQLLVDASSRFALDFKQFRARSDALRAAVDDRFEKEFATSLAALEKLGVNSESLGKVKAIEEGIRRDWVRRGVDVLCEKDEAEDLLRVRRFVADGFAAFSTADIDYLGRHGEWQDVALLISLLDRSDTTTTLLSSLYDDEKIRAIARAAYKIAKGRFSELCKEKMPTRLLAKVISHASNKDAAEMSDAELTALLNSESADVRKATLLRCISALTKTRLKRLLITQLTQEGLRYYNVTYWLDLGFSLSRKQITHVLDIVERKSS